MAKETTVLNLIYSDIEVTVRHRELHTGVKYIYRGRSRIHPNLWNALQKGTHVLEFNICKQILSPFTKSRSAPLT